jgi:hypothetical protein
MTSDSAVPFGAVSDGMIVCAMLTFPPACMGMFDSENVLDIGLSALSSQMKSDLHSELEVSSSYPPRPCLSEYSKNELAAFLCWRFHYL